MQNVAFGIFVLCIVLAVAGLIVPRRVLPQAWKPGRAKALGLYLLLALFALAAIGVFAPESARQQAWCEYERARVDLVHQSQQERGGLPREALEPGTDLLLEKPTPLAPRPGTAGLGAATTARLITEIVTLPAGAHVQVLERVRESAGKLWYRARAQDGREGYINPVALIWYDSMERTDALEKELAAWREPSRAKLEKTHITDKGFTLRDLEREALEQGWLKPCMERK